MIHGRTWRFKAGIAMASALAWTACTSVGGSTADVPPWTPADAGTRERTDSSSPDLGNDGGGITEPTADAGSSAGETDLGLCFDGRDNDDNHVMDCAERSCQILSGACCVGRGTAACCALPVAAPLLDFAGCGGDPSACLGASGGVAFGSSGATGALALSGDGSADTGVWLGQTHDLESSRVVLSARLALPACDSSCTAFAAIGLTAQDFRAGAPDNVRPIVALVASASLGEVRLMLGDAVAWSAPLPSGTSGGEAVYELTLAPDGTVAVSQDGVGITIASRFAPVRDAHVVVYGRSRNPSGPLPPAIADDIAVSDSLCDVPSAWQSRLQVLPMPGSGTTPTQDFRGPGAVLDADGKAYVAYASPASGALSLAEESGAPGVEARVLITTTTIVNPPADARYADPELVRAPDGEWLLYATRVDASGRSIVRFAGDSGTAPTFAATPVAASLTMPTELDGAALSEPAVAYDLGASTWRMWLHAADAASGHRIVELSSADGQTWAMTGTVVSTRPALGGFDADEVGAPAVVQRGGAWSLYFAGRRGARWAIGLVASDDRQHWTAPVFALSATGTEFDSLSVSDPSVVTRGESVELYYVGSNGVHALVGRAVRGATSTRAGAAAGGT